MPNPLVSSYQTVPPKKNANLVVFVWLQPATADVALRLCGWSMPPGYLSELHLVERVTAKSNGGIEASDGLVVLAEDLGVNSVLSL